MKKLLLSATLLSVIVIFVTAMGCKKKDKDDTTTTTSYSCASCTTTPEAAAANDNTSKGIYKGIIVGSSGTIKFDIGNTDSTLRAYMTIDGVSVTLTATVKWASGTSYVSPFTGTMNGSAVSITFSVDQTGANPTVTAIDIPGHPGATLSISKETSTNLIKCFEGTAKNLTTGKSSTFDLLLSVSLKKWTARVREDGSTGTATVDGSFEGTTLSFDDGKGASGSATLSGDNIINGTWKNSKPENGTWEAKRTM
jgi:hypothetical protein